MRSTGVRRTREDALEELVKLQDRLLVAYRTGSHRTADGVLTRISRVKAELDL